MEFIKVRNTLEVVRIEITVEFIGAWKYIYVVSTHPKKEFQYSSDKFPNPFPHVFPIDSGSIIIDTDNNWSFQLINQSVSDLDYLVKIDWFQGTDTKSLYTWEKSSNIDGQIKAGEIKKLMNSCHYEA